jgi:tetratricopeptide (TPR) repeat protein
MIAAVLGAALALVQAASAPADNTPSADQSCQQEMQDNQYAAAVKDCTQAITLNPKDESAYFARCAAYADLGNYDAAIADCSQAIALNPKNDDAYTDRCLANGYLANYSAALADCSQAIAINPKSANAYLNRCSAYGNMGKLQRGDCGLLGGHNASPKQPRRLSQSLPARCLYWKLQRRD